SVSSRDAPRLRASLTNCCSMVSLTRVSLAGNVRKPATDELGEIVRAQLNLQPASASTDVNGLKVFGRRIDESFEAFLLPQRTHTTEHIAGGAFHFRGRCHRSLLGARC